MTSSDRRVTGGVDAHADTHDAAALDDRGRLLGTRTFATDPGGQRALLAWLEQFGELAVVGVESTGSYAAGLVRYLRAHAVEAVEVNRPHAHARRRRGKSDPIDAEMAARQALAGDATAVPKLTTGIVESIRQLRVARDGAVKARSAAFCQLTDLIVTAPDELRDQLCTRKTTRGTATLCARLRPRASRLAEPAEAAKFALRSLARRIAELDHEITALDEQLVPLVATAAPRTTQLLGISTGHAGQLLVTAGQNIERLANDGAFAALCGASPIPISSGRRNRHRPRQDVVLGLLEQRGDLGQAVAQLGDRLAEPLAGLLSGVGLKHRADERTEQAVLVTPRVPQAVSEEVHGAALPRGAEDLRQRDLQARVGIGHRELDTDQSARDQAPEELAPERLGLALADVKADDLAPARLVDTVGDDHALAHDPAAGADLLDLGVDEQVGVAALQRMLAEGLHLLVEQPGDPTDRWPPKLVGGQLGKPERDRRLARRQSIDRRQQIGEHHAADRLIELLG